MIEVEDKLIISYDNCPPDVPTLIVARKDKYDATMLNKFQGDEAFGIYTYLTGGADLKSAREIPKKPIHIHEEYPEHLWKQNEEPCVVYKDICPTCGKELGRWLRGNYCYECGQALDWSEIK